MKQFVFFDAHTCMGCGACIRACPHGCIAFELELLNVYGVHPAFLRLPRCAWDANAVCAHVRSAQSADISPYQA